MTKPSNFIATTDFPTLKNDASPSATANIGSSVTIAGNGFMSAFGDVTAGQIGAISWGRISSSKNGSISYTGMSIRFERVGTNGGSPAPYDVFAFMYRVAPNTLRFQIYIPNPYGTTLTGEAGADTIQFYADTFLAPYA